MWIWTKRIGEKKLPFWPQKQFVKRETDAILATMQFMKHLVNKTVAILATKTLHDPTETSSKLQFGQKNTFSEIGFPLPLATIRRTSDRIPQPRPHQLLTAVRAAGRVTRVIVILSSDLVEFV